jgi:hypothetical protein
MTYSDQPRPSAAVRRGYRNVRRYAGGLLDWEDAGLPIEGEFAVRDGQR